MSEEVSEQQEAANVFGNLIGAVIGVAIWCKKPAHLSILLTIAALSSGGTIIAVKSTSPKSATGEKMDAALTNQVKTIDKTDSIFQEIHNSSDWSRDHWNTGCHGFYIRVSKTFR